MRLEIMIEDTSIKEALKKKIRNKGSISSSDLAATSDKTTADVPEDTDKAARLEKQDYDDPLTEVEHRAADGETIAGANPDEFITVDISDAEKNVFLEAMVTGERLVVPFSIMGGRITGKIRSRTQDETVAIVARLQHEIREKSVIIDAEYITRVRVMLIATQIAEYNGVENLELARPLKAVRTPEGGIEEPAWIEQLVAWERMDEGLAVALHEQIRKFEIKYWAMVRHAEDQNFWAPATSA